jgi:sugar/nucleoside kinase (ribokinase family)
VHLITPLAEDPAGRVLRGHLEGERVELTALPASRTSMVVVLVAPSGERSMLSDRRPVQGVVPDHLASSDWIHVSGYVLREPGEAERVVTAIRASGVDHVSVGGGSFEGSADAGVARDAIAAIGAGLVVMNRDEAGLLAGEPMRTAEEAVEALATSERLAVVTDGGRGSAAAGASIAKALSHRASPTVRRSVDTTGAGDAFTAALLAALAPGWPPDAQAVSSALEEAARAGAMATTVIGAQSVAEPDAAELNA